MPTVTFQLASPQTHRDALVALNTEYMTWIYSELSKTTGQRVQDLLREPIADYVTGMLDKVCGESPPRGAFYLVEVDGVPAGMGGLRWAHGGVAEVKRIYVRPSHRGLHLGRAILQRVLEDAKAFGYQRLVLDTGPFMQPAQRLYASQGFTDCGPHPGSEVPEPLHPIWRFMERAV